jgi:hypothetical protein
MINTSNKLVLLVALTTLSISACAKDPDCTSPEAWPSGMAFTLLKNEGMIDNKDFDYNNTQVKRFASERIGDDLYRQVHLIRFSTMSGKKVSVITVNDASSEECSMSPVEVYLLDKQLGELIK